MKQLTVLLVAMTISYGETKPTFIRGSMDIAFNSRIQPGKVGIQDIYTMNLNVCNSATFGGTIKFAPAIDGTFSVSQNAALNFDLECAILNPNNPNQSKPIGKIGGAVPIDIDGKYRFQDGGLKFALSANQSESRFGGIALGRALIKKQSMWEKFKGEGSILITRVVNGKSVQLAVNKYDKMQFQQHTLAKGPLEKYPETTVNGEMLYDYERSTWFFRGVTMNYFSEGRQIGDMVTGNIRWIAKTGEYQFDIRLNEKPANATESDVFTAAPKSSSAADEASFFAVDTSVSALTGTMKYRDSKARDTVTASSVAVDLTGNQLTQQQAMNLFKLVFISAIVPINAE